MTHHPPVMLVASSLDAHSDGIVQAAAKFAECSNAEIHLYHVIEQSRMSSFSSRVKGDLTSRGLSEDVEHKKRKEALHKQIRRCIPEGTKVASIAVSKGIGSTYRLVLEKAESIGATVIVLGPHTGAETTARLLGTTAERILRTAEIPCLVLSGALGNAPSNVGAAVDLSPSTKAVLASAGNWATACTKEDTRPVLDVLYVGWWVEREDNPGMEENVILPAIGNAFAEAQEDALSRELTFKTHVLWDNEPIQPILNWADVNSLDLLVLGTHGLTGLRRALLGSTASAVARRATCPILLVPPTTKE